MVNVRNRKKILYISYDDITEPLSRSQVLPYIRHLAKEYDMFLIVYNKTLLKNDKLEEIASRNGIRHIFQLKYHKRPSLAATCFDIFSGLLLALKTVKKYGIRLVHARSYIAAAVGFWLKKIKGIPYIFDIRGFLADERVDSGDWSKKSVSYRMVKMLEKVMLRDAEKIVILSKEGAKILETFQAGLEKKISVIPTCVDTELFLRADKQLTDRKFIRLVYFGSLGTWYMLPEMLDFFIEAKNITSDIKFIILTQTSISVVENEMKNKNISKDQIEIESVLHEDIPSYLKQCDASIFFIKPSFSKKASCPTKFAESICAGIPVIANTGIGDIDYYLKTYGTGVIVEHLRKEDYRNAFNKIYEMIKTKDVTSQKCRALCEKEFSLTNGVKKYKDIYKEIK